MEALSPPDFLKGFERTLFRRFWLKTVSFDLFDTLVTRPVSNPSDLFHLVEKEFLDRGYPLKNFAAVREKVEFEIREARSFDSEVQLSEIYEVLRKRFDLSAEKAGDLQNIELDVEFQRLTSIELGQKMLIRAAQAYRVIIITDTYFSKQFVERVVSKFNLNNYIGRIFCSSENGLQKSTGRLFEYVLREEGIKPKQLLHVGDNEISDIKNAKQWGIRGVLISDSLKNRYEQPLTDSTSFDESRVVGVTRAARLKNNEIGSHRSVIWEVGCNVAGPLIVSHVIWLLKKAKERGVDKLFFVARDGQVLLRIAKIVAPKICPNVKLHYLYSSRNALLYPSVTEQLVTDWDWIFARTSTLTARMVFSRLYHDIEDFEEELSCSGFDRKCWDRDLDIQDISCIKNILIDPVIQNRILDGARKARSLVLSYLRGVGFIGDGKSVLVDVGWNGTLQRAVSKILEAEGIEGPTEGFYFGLLNRKKHKEADQLIANFVDQVGVNRFQGIEYFVPLIELFVAATHGGTVRYENVNGEIKPKLRSEENETALSWGLDVLQESMVTVANEIVSFDDFVDLEQPLGELGIRNFKIFSTTPTRRESEVFGSFLDAEDQNETRFRRLATPLSPTALGRLKSDSLSRHNNDWRSASLALTPSILKRCFGVDDLKLAEHPVAGERVELVKGVGAVEGPVQELGLGRFVWIYGPRAVLRIRSTGSKPSRLKLRVRNFHGDQELSFTSKGANTHTEAVPVNFGALDQEDYGLSFDLPANAKDLEVVIETKEWQKEERPLAVILTRVEIENG